MVTPVKPILTCQNVSKHFGAMAAVDGLNLAVNSGEILGIGGPNGAGKTTLFEVLSGLNPATGGQVILDDRDITHLPPESICHAGLARTFQLNAGFDTLSIRDNVRVAAYFGRDNRRVPGLRLGRETERLTDAALKTVGLAGRDGELTGSLSVLDRKLLMLAGAVATRPRVLLMDEPVGGLTAREIDLMVDAVRKVSATGVTILLIEHVMRFLVQLSDRVLIMHHGQSIYEGSPSGLVHDRTVVDVYLGEGASGRLADLMAGDGG